MALCTLIERQESHFNNDTCMQHQYNHRGFCRSNFAPALLTYIQLHRLRSTRHHTIYNVCAAHYKFRQFPLSRTIFSIIFHVNNEHWAWISHLFAHNNKQLIKTNANTPHCQSTTMLRMRYHLWITLIIVIMQ